MCDQEAKRRSEKKMVKNEIQEQRCESSPQMPLVVNAVIWRDQNAEMLCAKEGDLISVGWRSV